MNPYQNTGSYTQFGNSYFTITDWSTTVGKLYTVSFEAISPNGDSPIQVYNSNGNPRYFRYSAGLGTVTTSWKRFSYTFTAVDSGGTVAVSHPVEIYAPNKMGVKIRNLSVLLTSSYIPALPALPHNISSTGNRMNQLNLAFNFTGNSYMTVDLPCTTNMTFALWFKPNSTSGTHVIDFRDANSGYQPFYMSGNSIQTGGSAGYPSINVTLSTSEWQHIAIVYTASNIKIYRNGVLAGTTTEGHGGEHGTKTLYIGCRYSLTNWLNGSISDFLVWNEALDATAIQQLM